MGKRWFFAREFKREAVRLLRSSRATAQKATAVPHFTYVILGRDSVQR